MKNLLLTILILTSIANANAQTKIIDAVKALSGKAIIGTTTNKKPLNFFLEYDDNSKSVYAKTTGGDYSNLRETIYFINDYVATLGWVSYEEENGVITYNTKLIVADGNKIIIGRPWAVKSISSDKPYEIICDGKMSIDNIYAQEKIEPTEKNDIVAKCKTQIVSAMQEIATRTKNEVEKISNNNLVLIGKLRQVERTFKNYYYTLQPKAAVIASIKGKSADIASEKQTAWENAFAQKVKSGEYKSFASFAKELKNPANKYEYVTIKVVYNRDTEKYTYTIGDKVITPLKNAIVTYEPKGSNIVKQIELIPEEDNYPKTPYGDVSLHFTGYTVTGDENYVPDGYILNKRSFAAEKGIYYKGYFIIKQQGDFIEDSRTNESYYNYFAIRPVGLKPIVSNRKEFDDAYYQYSIKEKLMSGEKINF